jgi:hypothetical protein
LFAASRRTGSRISIPHVERIVSLARPAAFGLRRRPNGSVRALDYSTPAFTVDLKIPDPYNKDQPLWPPLQLTPSQQLARAMLANPDAYADRFVVSEAAAGTYIGARNRRILEDNRRQIAEAEQRQREREQREAAERRKSSRPIIWACTYLLTDSMTLIFTKPVSLSFDLFLLRCL